MAPGRQAAHAPRRREVLTAEVRAHSVGVAPAKVFAVGCQPVSLAVRVCLQAARRHLLLV